MTLGEYPMKRIGSQGQNKTFLIALKLAQFDFLNRNGFTSPILLLDDIFDKLDSQRMERIISLVSEERFGQIFITDTNREYLDEIIRKTGHDFHLYQVIQGNIDRVLKEQNLDLKLDETRLIKAWNSLLGEQVASYTTKLYIQRGVLYVHLSSSVLRSELSMCRNMLMDRLNKQVGRQIITNIIFR